MSYSLSAADDEALAKIPRHKTGTKRHKDLIIRSSFVHSEKVCATTRAALESLRGVRSSNFGFQVQGAPSRLAATGTLRVGLSMMILRPRTAGGGSGAAMGSCKNSLFVIIPLRQSQSRELLFARD